ncbi:putative transporter small subunit, partial [Streptomyces kebangsaanensis]|uniref:putative transporter small subunit n=1 Tax=Streptomyces kebangsaanensis TaxID=864058 RepID=UPI002D21D10E
MSRGRRGSPTANPALPQAASEERGGPVTTFALSVYVLIWPAIVAAVLFVISRGFFR